LINEIRERALSQKALINIMGKSPAREGSTYRGEEPSTT
jgi:hypothetical protein